MPRKSLSTVPSLLLLLLTLGIFAGFAPEASAAPTIGDAAAPFSLESLDGDTLSLDDLEGEIVVVHFATSWCPFCNAEAPTLNELHAKYDGRGVRVIVIDVAETPEVARSWAERYEVEFPVLLDRDGAVSASYAPDGVHPELPRDQVVIASNLLIDRDGTIAFYSLLDTASFDAQLTALRARLSELLGE